MTELVDVIFSGWTADSEIRPSKTDDGWEMRDDFGPEDIYRILAIAYGTLALAGEGRYWVKKNSITG